MPDPPLQTGRGLQLTSRSEGRQTYLATGVIPANNTEESMFGQYNYSLPAGGLNLVPLIEACALTTTLMFIVFCTQVYTNPINLKAEAIRTTVMLISRYPYPYDRRADKDSYPHDRNVTDDLCSLIQLLVFIYYS